MADLTKHLMETDEQFKVSEERLIEDLKRLHDQLQPRIKSKKQKT